MSADDDVCESCGRTFDDTGERLERIETILTTLTKDLDSVMTKATEVLETCEPTIRQLSNHPMMKMLGVGKR